MRRLAALLVLLPSALLAAPPNVILMMTDDQGIGDFGVMGNEMIETPNIDALAAGSGSLTHFYVSPVCSPTRASLMTGRYNQRTRCIDTWVGRSMMDSEEYTLAEALGDAGYATGIFGKWHLGDCYPMRPQDQGFDEALYHLGGGLAQPSEPVENERRYTDPILMHRGEPVQTEGYCTDVYFDHAIEFIDAQTDAQKPFFIYLPTNAPHGPYHDVPEDLREHYMAKDLTKLMVTVPKDEVRRDAAQDQLARICAMITNEHQSVGRLMEHLEEKGLAENTLVIRLNDNGPNSMRYVGDKRGMKTHVHEGGVRSPCWFHWPAQIKPGTEWSGLAAHIDLMPTILAACGAEAGPKPLDGRSILQALTMPERVRIAQREPVVIQSHRGDVPVRYHHFMIRHGDWKLLHASGFGDEEFEGEPEFELYNLRDDPGEGSNLIGSQPEVFARLKDAYDAWFDDACAGGDPAAFAPPNIVLGNSAELTTILTWQDRRGGDWNPGSNGHWLVEIERVLEADIEVIFHEKNLIEGGEVQLSIGETRASGQIGAGVQRHVFEGVSLPAGEASVEVIKMAGDTRLGAYQVIVRAR